MHSMLFCIINIKNQDKFMGKRGAKVIFSDSVILNARKIIDKISYRDDILMAFSVVLSSLGMDYRTLGGVLGVSVSTVKRMNNDFKSREMSEFVENKPRWGGDRKSTLSFDEEVEVLDSLHSAAKAGSLVTAASVRAELEARAASTMSIQTVYNILHRHRWRKVAPDKVHPKNDPAKLEEFKKKRFPTQYAWQPSTPAWREKNYE